MLRSTVAALLGLLLVAGPAAAYELKKDASGEVVRWATTPTFVMSPQLDAELGAADARAAVQAAAATLRAASGLQLRVVEGAVGAVGYDPRAGARNQSEIVAVSDWEFDERAIAVTVVTFDTRTHALLDADVAFNLASRRFGVLDEDTRPGGVLDDVQNTLTHELGHALGLAHNPAEPEAVMYPSAFRGEVTKRVLSDDDRAGLEALYGPGTGAAAADAAQDLALAQGCSASGGAPTLALLALLAVPLLGRRRARRLPAAAALLVPALALGSSQDRVPAPVREAAVVATTRVVAVRTLPRRPGQTLWVSEVEAELHACLKGPCPERLVVRVPGGRVGDLEQVVEGLEVPRPGDALGVTVAPGASAAAPAPRATRVYRLAHLPEFSAFAQGLRAAGWQGRLEAPAPAGSAPTAASATTPTPSR